jgi:hypothetical protein
MTTAETNDSLRKGIVRHFFLGQRVAPPAGNVLAFSPSVSAAGATAKQVLMEAVLVVEAFDDDDHTSATFEGGAYTASFTLTDNDDGAKTLLVGMT